MQVNKDDISNNDLVRKFLSETKMTSKKGVARILFEKYPYRWNSVEDARTCVKYVTGSAGEKKRREIKDPEKSKFFYNGFEKWATENLNTELEPWHNPYQIPTGIKVLNIIADLHSVHLDYKVLQKFIKETKNKEALLINGDLLDSESLSRHIKSHNLISYEAELELCHTILKELKKEFTHVYFHQGNHDFWLERYLLTNAREIFRLRGLELFELLRCGELGIHTIHNLQYMTFGDLDILHGHQFQGFGAGKFPAGGILDKWQTFKGRYDVKVMASHSHRNDHQISKKSKDGKFGEAWVTPALCRKGASYNPYAGWDNGWVEAKINNDGITEIKTFIV